VQAQLFGTQNTAHTPLTSSGPTQIDETTGTDPPAPSNYTQVIVNGRSIPIPSQGSTSRTTNKRNATMTVNISNSSSMIQDSPNSSSSSGLNVDVRSSSSSMSSAVSN
jgi:hypothetical protein